MYKSREKYIHRKVLRSLQNSDKGLPKISQSIKGREVTFADVLTKTQSDEKHKETEENGPLKGKKQIIETEPKKI